MLHSIRKRLSAPALGLALAVAATLAAPAPAMATMKITTAVADSLLTTLKAKPNSGTLVVYSGTQPADPDTALSGNTALATWTFNNPACGSNSSSGNFKVCTASLSASSVTIGATGTASFARMYESDGTTVDGDFTVGTSGTDITFPSVAFSSGVTATLSSFQLKVPFH